MPRPPASRVPPLPPSGWTAAHRDVIDSFPDADPLDPLFATLLQVPEIAQAVMPMTGYIIRASTLSPPHRLLLARRTAWLDRSETEWATHAAGRAAEEQRRVGLILGQVDGDDEDAQALLQLADELVLNASVTDSTWAALAGSHDVPWLMDAVETVAQVSFLDCLARAFGVCPPDPIVDDASLSFGRERDRLAAPPREPALTSARIEPVTGDQIAVLRTFAQHPVMAAARRPRASFVNQWSPLTPHDREVLILRIGWDCQSEYEWAKHVGSVGRAREHGVDPELVAAGPTAPGVSAGDALLMRVADELYEDATVSDDAWSALLERHGRSGAMSVVFTASSYRATSMSLNAYGVQLEPGDEGFRPGESG